VAGEAETDYSHIPQVAEENEVESRMVEADTAALGLVRPGLTSSNNDHIDHAAEHERDLIPQIWSYMTTEAQRQGALIRAVYEGKDSIVATLLGLGTDKDCQGEVSLDGRGECKAVFTPLTAAAQMGHTRVVEVLLAANANAEKGITYSRGRHGPALLMSAAKFNRLGCIKCLLSAGVNVNAHNGSGFFPLRYATIGLRHECMHLLLSNGASVYVRADLGTTPLHWVLRLFIPCPSNHHGMFDRSELEWQNDGELCMHLLLSFGADKDAKDEQGDTPLIYAVHGNHPNFVKMLLDKGCNVDQGNNDGTTPLMHAVSHNQLEIIKVLLKANADKTLVDREGKTAIQRAEELGNREVVAMLGLQGC